jgi:hypothetical protein
MSVQISTDHNAARLDATRAFVDQGTGDAQLQVYSGTRPALGGSAGMLLATISLPKPCGVVSGGVLVLTASTSQLVAASGTAAWGRVLNGGGDLVLDCDVSATGGSGDLQLSTTTLYAGGSISLTGGALG